MADLAYIRVSTTDQNPQRQLADCEKKWDKVFTDFCSGSSTDRPELQRLKEYAREGDTIHVHSIDRLARNLTDLKQLVSDWNTQGIGVHFHQEALNFSAKANTPMAELLLNMLGAVAQFELALSQERRQEGIAKAKAAGKFKGRPINEDTHERICALRKSGLSIRETAKAAGVSPSTVQRALAVS
ncbi:resolvase [Agarivorans sp. B2Z047]|uniref:recombinase family protein n=1 Tax=Agarivorans sp. B2Z047 TaxID=2652721 RepID=UPI00128CEDF6|nr:recombinase family protein [Agarivorans sp. B2Z047]MPW28266.1 resolvase [Agarivorans sp. B2Z047]UQN43906.1 recombinase family protein [Agarivorans sp. B2Z047]